MIQIWQVKTTNIKHYLLSLARFLFTYFMQVLGYCIKISGWKHHDSNQNSKMHIKNGKNIYAQSMLETHCTNTFTEKKKKLI